METKTAAIIEKLTDGLNEEQKQAVLNPIDSCTKIVAGAGSGKTKIISKRFVKLTNDLIANNIETPVSRLLVITFTDKAANEMKGRILSELNDNKIDSLGQEFWVSTFHSFCSKILRKHSIEANLSPSFKLGEEKELEEAFDSIIKSIKYGETQKLENINEIAQEIGLEPDILSIESVNRLKEIDYLDNILASLFPLIKKIKSQGLNPKDFLEKSLEATKHFTQVISTLPFGFQTKDDYLTSWEKHLEPYADDFCEYEKQTINDNGKTEKKGAFGEITKVKLILDKNNKRKAEGWTRATALDKSLEETEKLELHLTKITALVYALYQNKLEELDIIDFDDLINKVIEILKKNELIRLFYQKQFTHIIVDEFQDTNGSQLELIKLLLNPQGANITFVGDRKQSIYSFRHAQMENLEVLHNHVQKKYQKDYPEIKLVKNYRSTDKVLEAVNHVTTQELKLDEELIYNKTDSNEDNVKVTLLSNIENKEEHKEAEAKYIASEIVRLKNRDNANYKDFAVLVKSHAQAEIVEKQLAKYGIPSIKKVNLNFFSNPIIKNAESLMALKNNYRNELALVRILQIYLTDKELFTLKKQLDTVPFVLEQGQKPNLAQKAYMSVENGAIEKLEIADETKELVKKLFKTIKTIEREESSLTLVQVFYRLINTISPYTNLSGFDRYKAEADLKIFEKIIVDYMKTGGYINTQSFLEYLDNRKEDRQFELPTLSTQDVDAVQLLTIYASKGLEFPYTFITNISNKSRDKDDDSKIIFDLQYGEKPGFGVIISKYRGQKTAKYCLYKEIWQKPRSANEALRLFYVAVSRAEKYLNVLSFEPYGFRNSLKPATYIQNMPKQSEPTDISQISLGKQVMPHYKIEKENALEPVQMPNLVQPEAQTLNLSFSKLNTFSECKNKFILKNIFNYPELSETQVYPFVGNVVHNLIYSSYLNSKIFSEEEIKDSIKELKPKEEDLKSVIALYKAFLNSDYSPENLKSKTKYPEKGFKYVYQLDNNQILFNGDIDLIIKNEEDNTFSIIDFKTGEKTEKNLNSYYKQLYIYKKALESEGMKVKEAKILALSKAGSQIFTPTEDDFEQAKTAIDSQIKDILELNKKPPLTKGENSAKCFHCGYSYMCLK